MVAAPRAPGKGGGRPGRGGLDAAPMRPRVGGPKPSRVGRGEHTVPARVWCLRLDIGLGWFADVAEEAFVSSELRDAVAEGPILFRGLENVHEHVLRPDAGAFAEQFHGPPE